MLRKLLCIALLFFTTYSSVLAKVNTKATDLYVYALGQYIKTVYDSNAQRPDTLFVGKNIDMPKIILPAKIDGIPVVLLSSEAAERKLSYRNTLVYVNIVGWIDKETSEFIVVKFHEFKPIHNCHIHLSYSKTGTISLDSLRFEYPYGKNLKQ